MILAFLILLFLAGSFFFAGTETAFTTYNRLRVRAWAQGEDRRGRRARAVERFAADPQRFLTTTLVGNNIAIVAVTALVGYILEQVLVSEDSHALIQVLDVILVTPLLLVFGEIIPKSIASHYPNRTSLWGIAPLRVSHVVLQPVIWVVGRLLALVRHLLRIPSTTDRVAMRRKDVVDLLSPQDDDEVDKEEEILSSILEFRESTVRDALTPRTRLVALDIEASEEEILEVLSDGRFSRLPVYDNDVDHIVGVVHATDLLLASCSGPIELRPHLRAVPFVPEQKRADQMLEELRGRKEHLAVVLDEHGGTEGIVTLEDLLELLVGDIRDEHDAPDDLIRPIGDQAWTARGHVELDDLEDAIGLELPDGQYETLGGYVIDRLGRIPIKGEAVAAPGARITVIKSSDRAIQLLRVDLLES